MPGWRIAVAAFASLKNRCTSSVFSVSSGRSSLTAATAPEQLVLGAVHRAHAAARQLAGQAVAAEHRPDHRVDDSNPGDMEGADHSAPR